LYTTTCNGVLGHRRFVSDDAESPTLGAENGYVSYSSTLTGERLAPIVKSSSIGESRAAPYHLQKGAITRLTQSGKVG
jgi:hypothetical protein